MDLDSVAAVDLGRGWLEAFNRRDAEALVELADAGIVFHATALPGDRGPYLGHDGLRRWIADVRGADVSYGVELVEARYAPEGDLVVLGEIVLDAARLGPYTVLMALRAGRVLSAHAYLSSEVELVSIGRIRQQASGRRSGDR